MPIGPTWPPGAYLLKLVGATGEQAFVPLCVRDDSSKAAILLMHAHRLRSCEIPVQMRPRLTGQSVISSSQSVYYMVKVLLAVFVGLFRRRPTVEAGEPAAVSAEPAL